ncbi:MAG: DegT/DnrJ/EryC1/StrS family aminotransferase [bacterium]|nr:DegT/DnrJ/EryC1/StrS family aminotransferase [bacterium]
MIPFVDFTREYKEIGKEIDVAIKEVLERGFFILGPELENFEKKFAEYCDAKYCVGVNSGTDALYLSLLCAGIGPGDEVIVPVNTAVPTAMAVSMSGAKPVFADCDENFLIDIDKIPQLLTKKTKAIMPVHLYGRACDMGRLKKLAVANKLFLIEDCAQSAGAEWDGKKVGTLGDFGCFSFYPTKNLGAYGDGGAVIINNEDYYKKLLASRFYGQADRVHCSGFGINSRLDEIQAAILNAKLKHLDIWNNARQKIADLYRKLITNPKIILPAASNDNNHIYHLFVIRAPKRDSLKKILEDKGIKTAIHYPAPLSRHSFFAGAKQELFPMADQYAGEILSLPMHPFLEESEIREIADVLNNYA